MAAVIAAIGIGGIDRLPGHVQIGQVGQQSLIRALNTLQDGGEHGVVGQQILTGFGADSHADVFPDLDGACALGEALAEAFGDARGEITVFETAGIEGGRPGQAPLLWRTASMVPRVISGSVEGSSPSSRLSQMLKAFQPAVSMAASSAGMVRWMCVWVSMRSKSGSAASQGRQHCRRYGREESSSGGGHFFSPAARKASRAAVRTLRLPLWDAFSRWVTAEARSPSASRIFPKYKWAESSPGSERSTAWKCGLASATFALPEQRQAQIEVGRRQAGFDLDGAAVLLDGALRLRGLREYQPEADRRLRKARIERERSTQFGFGLGKHFLFGEGASVIVVRHGVLGIAPDGFSEMILRLLEFALLLKDGGQVTVRRGQRGAGTQGALEGAGCRGQIAAAG